MFGVVVIRFGRRALGIRSWWISTSGWLSDKGEFQWLITWDRLL